MAGLYWKQSTCNVRLAVAGCSAQSVRRRVRELGAQLPPIAIRLTTLDAGLTSSTGVWLVACSGAGKQDSAPVRDALIDDHHGEGSQLEYYRPYSSGCGSCMRLDPIINRIFSREAILTTTRQDRCGEHACRDEGLITGRCGINDLNKSYGS
jgi:hypothetical protein